MGRRETPNAAPARSPRLIDYPRSGRRGVRLWLPSWKLVSGWWVLGLAFVAGLYAFERLRHRAWTSAELDAG